jgi:hypothetical protein
MAAMQARGRRKELAQHVVDRRRREDEAHRLIAEVPTLARLSLSIEEHGTNGVEVSTRHVRRVVVEHAAAHFELGCSAEGCEGAHDATSAVMRELRSGARHLEGEIGCSLCGCVLRYVGDAEYRPEPGASLPVRSPDQLKKR